MTLIQRRLGRESPDLLLAENGVGALRMAVEERPDLVILD